MGDMPRSFANGDGHGATRGPAADMRAWVDERAGYVTSQGTKPPLRAPDPLHAASHTMPAHVLCVAAANNLVYPITEGPGAKRVNPCTDGRPLDRSSPQALPRLPGIGECPLLASGNRLLSLRLELVALVPGGHFI